MNGVTLPPIPGAALRAGGGSDSRPHSRASSVSSSGYTVVPHVYYNEPITYRSTPRTSRVSGRRYTRNLPSLKHAPHHKLGCSFNEVRARYSAKYRKSSGRDSRLCADSPFLPSVQGEDCLKCLLRVPHRRCESHKYIRVGGGYRHGYWYVKCLLEELELQRQRELLRQQRLDAIQEKRVKAIKTYIRTKSGRLVERIIFLSEEDYEAFKDGKNAKDILKKYLNKDEAKGLESWDKDEVKAIKTYVRTKSGRLVERLVYVSKKDYEDIKAGKVDANKVLKKYVKASDGETVEGWGEAKMKTIKTYVRTKSGKLVEKVIMISEEDYNAMLREGKNPNDIIKKYLPLGEGETIDSWQSGEPMKAIKTKVRTKSGRIIEKTIFVSADDYERMTKGGQDASEILKKYLNTEDGDTIEGWEKAPDGQPMKVVKTYIRTKSGKLIEKQILLTEDEYRKFQESGGDPDFLKKFIKLEAGEKIEDWEKASTVYSMGDDEEFEKAAPGQRIVGKDGAVYEVVVDPVTGKKYKKKVGQQESDVDSGIASMSKGGKGRRGGKGGGIAEEDETPQERARRKAGMRDRDSDSDYSYKSFVSDGGTRHVRRKKKNADGTYGDSESYHSSQDEEGQARRRRRRRDRRHGADSAHSYYSVTSAGGTRHVKRRRKRADGTYSASESYHSSDSGLEGGGLAERKKKKEAAAKKKKGKVRREHGSDSEHSYYSEVSEGGTRTRKRKKRIRDKDGKVIGYGAAEAYSSPDDSDSQKKRKKNRELDSPPVFSDVTTDDDDVDLENMTEEEKKKYFEEKAKRAAEREKRRREKYGDKYDELMAKHKEWGKRQKGKKGKDGNEADDESEDGGVGGKGKRRGKGRRGSNESQFEYEYDDQGRVIRKKRRGKGSAGSGSEYEYEYDAEGNVKVKKKDKRRGSQSDDDGNYFEVDEKGQVKLKAGKKKIDLSKLSKEDLEKLGIDPNLSKQEIARLLKQKFGDDIQITDNKKKVGTKRIDEYGSDADTDDLANDSDLDVSTLKGPRRVNVMMRRGGQELIDHMKRVIEASNLQAQGYAKDLDERDGDIDFLSHYRLVDPGKIESYARCFVVEDGDFDTVITSNETRVALDGVPSIQHMTEKQMEYVLKVLKIDDASQVTFRMFAVISALCERVTQMDYLSKHLLEICDLMDIERKMDLYKAMFYCNVSSDRDANFIKADSLRIELIAGGLNWKQQEYIMDRLQPNHFNEISFLDYICYIPLFLSMHDNICDNPLDMSDNKYSTLLRKPSGQVRQRDVNPLQDQLDKYSPFQMRQQAQLLLEGKVSLNDIKTEKRAMVEKYAKLPKLLEEETPVTGRSDSTRQTDHGHGL